MTRSFLDRWHRPAGYHRSTAAGVPSRLTKSAFSRIAGHYQRKEAAQEQELAEELKRVEAEAREMPTIEGEVGVRVASVSDLPREFTPLGTGFFRLGHSIWEMRADDSEGYRLVRKHEEIAVDMREQPRTASQAEPQPGDVLFIRVADVAHPVILLSLPMDGMSSVMDMLGGSAEVPADELLGSSGTQVFPMDAFDSEAEYEEEEEEDEEDEEEDEEDEDEEASHGLFSSIYDSEDYDDEDEDEDEGEGEDDDAEEHEIEVNAPAVIRVKLTAAADDDEDDDDDSVSVSDQAAFLDRILASALPPPLESGAAEEEAKDEDEAEMPKAASRKRRR